jgi:methylmalonyl-CoA/ethylmalonyl-CoA epimerase
MLRRLNHVAIAVPDLTAAIALYRTAFAMEPSPPQSLSEHGVTISFVDAGNTMIELMEPFGDNSPLRAFLDKNPAGGIHHLCYEVDDILAARDHLKAEGARILGDGEPKIGAHGRPVLFLHPKDFNGTLIELEQV